MKQIKLAFAGKMYTGKDTSADIWCKRMWHWLENNPKTNRAYLRLAFASELKQLCIELFGLTVADVNSPDGKKRYLPKYGKTVRELMQGIGQGLREYIHPDIWVIKMEDHIKRILDSSPDTDFVITDVRYPNEAAMLKRLGFTIIRLLRNTGVNDSHPSEHDLPDNLVDYIVDNNGTINELESKLILLPEFQFD